MCGCVVWVCGVGVWVGVCVREWVCGEGCGVCCGGCVVRVCESVWCVCV